MGKVVEWYQEQNWLEAARVARWERTQADHFKSRDNEQAVWVCNCGCWQYELRPVGVFCVSCGAKQSVSVKI